MRQVDPTAVQAAEGVGMRPWEVILRVELPLAAPTIMAGVRTAAINIFATATIASFVGPLHPRGPDHGRATSTATTACWRARS